MRTRVLVFASVISFGVAASVLAQADPLAYCEGDGVKWGVGLTLLSAPGGDKVGFRGTLNGCKTGYIAPTPRVPGAERSGFPCSYMLRFDVNLLVADAALRVPETSSLHVSHSESSVLETPKTVGTDRVDCDLREVFCGGVADGAGRVGCVCGGNCCGCREVTVGSATSLNLAKMARTRPLL